MSEIRELADCCVADCTALYQQPMCAGGLASSLAKVTGRQTGSGRAGDKGPQAIEIQLQELGGDAHMLSAQPTATLLSIKWELEAITGIDIFEQQVYLPADADRCDYQYGLSNMMVVHEILVKGGNAVADGNSLALVLVRVNPASILVPALAEELGQETYDGVISAAQLGVLAIWAKQLVDMHWADLEPKLLKEGIFLPHV
jgi:hypothetical protein